MTLFNMRISQTTAKKPRTLQCPDCDLTVARPSHLARHLQSHLPPARREHFSCGECGRQFSRNDVLLRHLRTAHQASITRKKSAQKSCFRCVKKKLKCDRVRPCVPCTKSSSPCQYPGDEPLGDSKAPEGKAESPPQKTPHYQESDYRRHPDHPLDLVQAPPGFIPNTAQRPPDAQAFHDAPFFQHPPEPNSMPMIPPDLVSFSTTSPTNVGNDFNQAMMGFEGAYLPGDYNFMPSNSAPKIAGMAEGGVDWLNLELDSPNNGDPTQSLGPNSQPGSIYHVPTSSSISGGTMEALHDRNYQNVAARFEPIRAQDSNSAKAIESQAAAHQWPFDHTRNPEPPKYRLPPLRDILQGTMASSGQDNGNTIRSLIQLLSASYLPEIDFIQDMSTMSAMELLKTSLELYFSEFHAVLPLVHMPTFNMAKVPTVTLAAMSCIGAMYSDDRQGTEQSWSLSEICIQMIAWLGGADSTNYYNAPYLIACCLHQIYSLGSGNRRLYQNADCSRGILIGCLRGMGLLKSRVSTEFEKDDVINGVSTSDPSSEWLRWKDQEQEKRIAWSSFEYDCSLCTLTSRRGAVDLPELPSHLPCAEPLWDAPSAQAWIALYSRSSPTARGAPTSKMLRNILAGKPVPEDLPAWSRRLCAQSIGRLLWDIKQLDIMSTTEYLKLPSLAIAQRQTKSTLLQGLNALCESMYNLSSTAELIHYNLISLICHYSHLYSADEAMDLVVHIFRISASQSKPPNNGLASAKRRLSSILRKNPHKARNLAWHAAQIIAVANEYLVSAPCEILRVFMGYTFILAFAKFGPQPSPDTDCESCSVHLDLSNHRDGQRTAISTWIENGGRASVGAAENIFSEEGLKVLSQDAQTMLRKMRFWGLAKKFIRILESFDINSD
ncbi:uncharacterized protein Z518_04111 [Rhinocladiella mackenziei CBS 650.93]|uniref:C2H2 type zinc finger domain protein n=1 Tax=Rhinocladiella mackenziei CBS 650.93 TaxID=1442369 RepID=A0A0D2FVG1_9EURO|nr:uncharacterized protein Z518_04111 [Rhinocladiella mackenziei CBS 650.93]KIX06137.1 hypothetical protein Z518_04111 [Rhinocladiella mackenziei CBS 650.93]